MPGVGFSDFRNVSSLLFDLDGTLIDSLPGIRFSIGQAFAACGRSLPEIDVRGLLGPPIGSILQKLGGDISAEEVQALVRAFRASYDSVGWQRTRHYPGVAETLARLKDQRLRLFVVTNKPQHVTRTTLDRLGTARLFEEILSRDSRSPAFMSKGEMLQYAMARHDILPEAALMVGDTMEDVDAARETGIRVVVVKYGYGTEHLRPAPNICAELDDFKPMLSDLANSSPWTD